jgi:hypothetical protein
MHSPIARQSLSKHIAQQQIRSNRGHLLLGMDVFSVWSDPKLYNEMPTTTESSLNFAAVKNTTVQVSRLPL